MVPRTGWVVGSGEVNLVVADVGVRTMMEVPRAVRSSLRPRLGVPFVFLRFVPVRLCRGSGTMVNRFGGHYRAVKIGPHSGEYACGVHQHSAGGLGPCQQQNVHCCTRQESICFRRPRNP
jgi:hypothetical protein